MNLTAEACANVLHHLCGKEGTEEIRQQETRQINALVRIGITVVILNTRGVDPEKFARHVAKETRLLILNVRIRPVTTTYMREEFLRKNILYIQRTMAAR